MNTESSDGHLTSGALCSDRLVPKREHTPYVRQTREPQNISTTDTPKQPQNEAKQPAPGSIEKEEENLPFSSHSSEQELLSPSPSNISESPSCGGPHGARPRAIWPGGGPSPFPARLKRASPSRGSSDSFLRVLSPPGPPLGAPQGPSRQGGYSSRAEETAATPNACNVSLPSISGQLETDGTDDSRDLGYPSFVREGLDALQQLVDSLMSVFRSGAVSLLSAAKWVLLLSLSGLVLFAFVFFCLSVAAAISYYLISVYSTAPPLHEFPVYFDYFPRVAMALSAAHRGAPAAAGASSKEGFSSLEKGSFPDGAPALERRSEEGPPLGAPGSWGHLEASRDLPLPPACAHLWGPARCGGASLRGPPWLLFGFSLSALEDPVALAIVPFSNRSWELLPGDVEMFTPPDIYPSSHWPQQQQQQQQQYVGLHTASPLKEDKSKLPLFDVDIILHLSLPAYSSSKADRETETPPVMLSLFLYSEEGDVVARSSRPLPPPSCSPPLLSRLLPSVFCVNQTEATIYLMEHFPLSLVAHLKYARVYLYPPMPLLSSSLIIQPKPEGLRLLVIQHPYLTYLFLTLLLLAAAAAAICCCCCCCCGYLLALASPEAEVDNLQGPHLRPAGAPSQEDGSNSQGECAAKQQGQNTGEKKALLGAPNLRLRVDAGRQQAARGHS